MPAARPVVFYETPCLAVDSGWQIAARKSARAMAAGGLDVRMVPFGEAYSSARADSPHLSSRPSRYDVHLLSGALLDAARMTPLIASLGRERTARSFHAMFERRNIEPALAAAFNQLGPIWAQCTANREALVRAGVTDVTVIPVAYFDGDPLLALPAPKTHTRFLWIGRNEPRKNPRGLLRAFLTAFRPGQASLTMKFQAPYLIPMPAPEQVLVEELRAPEIASRWSLSAARAAIRMIHDRLSESAIVQLYADHDVYCSASHGEGLDLPAFAAKLGRRTLVTTDSGGPRDFISEGDVLVPVTAERTITPVRPWESGHLFAAHDPSKLVAALQEVAGAAPVGSRVSSVHHAPNVGQAFRAFVERLIEAPVPECKPAAPPFRVPTSRPYEPSRRRYP